MTELIISCPHCAYPVIIQEINCGIFRHAILKTSGEQINPHTNKQDCERLIHENRIYGCGKPFQIIRTNGLFQIQICDYI